MLYERVNWITSIRCSAAAGHRVVGEQPVAQHGERINVHPLVLGEALPHTEHREEIPRHRPIQLCYRQRLKNRNANKWKAEHSLKETPFMTKFKFVTKTIILTFLRYLISFSQLNKNSDGSPDGTWVPWRSFLTKLRLPAQCSRTAASQQVFYSRGSHDLQKQTNVFIVTETMINKCRVQKRR